MTVSLAPQGPVSAALAGSAVIRGTWGCDRGHCRNQLMVIHLQLAADATDQPAGRSWTAGAPFPGARDFRFVSGRCGQNSSFRAVTGPIVLTSKPVTSGRIKLIHHCMGQLLSSRGVLSQTVSVLCLFALLATGIAEVRHLHPAGPQGPSHSCSICAPHAVGLRTESVSVTPGRAEALLAPVTRDFAHGYRTVFSTFVRPPPSA